MTSKRLGFRRAAGVLIAWALVIAACGDDDGGEGAADDAATNEDAGSSPTGASAEGVGVCDDQDFQVAFSQSEGTAATVQYAAYVAQGAGTFDEVGLNVEFIGLGGTSNILGAVVSDDADVGILTMPGVLQAVSEGAPLQTIAALQQGATLAIPITSSMAEQIGVELGDVVTAEDIARAEGLRMGTSSIGGGGHSFARLVLSAGGLEEGSDWEILALNDSAGMVAAFGQGIVDAISASSSTADSAVEEFGGAYLFDPFNQTLADISPDLAQFDLQQGAVAVASADAVADADRTAAFECFVNAMKLTNELIIDDPTAAGEAAYEFFEQYRDDREAFDVLAAGLPNVTSESVVISPEAFEATLAYLDQTPDTAVEGVTYDQVVHTAFAEAVDRR